MDKGLPNIKPQRKRARPQHISSPLSKRQLEHITALSFLDFQSERLNRKEAQNRAAQLEQELNLIRTQLNAFQETAMSRLHNNRMAFLSNLQNKHASPCDSEKVTKDIDFVDSLTPISVTKGKGQLVADKEKELPIIEDNMLKCHKCNSEWNADDHKKFLKHIDTCVPKN